MKTQIRLIQITLVLLVLAAFSSCQKNPENFGKGTAEFSLSLPGDAGLLKSANMLDSGGVSYQLMVSVVDMQGNAIITDKLIPLYSFGTGFVSENLEIKAGEYKLTKFMVINPEGKVIYASPLAGSPLAYLTVKPLPFNFTIIADQVTKVVPEVLTVGDQSPDQFGYANFGIQVIKPLIFYTICVFDPGNPMIMAPIQITTAKLTVWANNGWHYTFMLQAAVNKLIIRGGSDIYKFVLEKEGYASQTLQFTAAQLMETTAEKPLYLKIPWGSQQYQILTLQPGPEAGKDAMISNLEPDKNFGAHKYFEATFLTEPILTVMRLNRSLIWFDLSTLPKSAIIKKVTLILSYDLPIPWDSTILVPGTSATSFVGAALQQVIEPWEESKVSWNNQPASIEANQVLIYPFIRNVNMIEVDVTKLFVSPLASPLPNYGMKFKLLPENKFPGFRFASSDYPEAAMRPKLNIFYTVN
jgi:hypothetical protein